MSTAIGKLTAKFSETTIDDEVVVMQLDSGSFFSLTGTARAIWLLIDGTRDRAALLTAVAAEFGAVEVDIAADVDEFLASLHGTGFIA